MALQPRPANCERARAWASLRLDGELSELEDALLAAHLHQCRPCSEYVATVSEMVSILRSRPLERLDHGVSVPARHRVLLRPAALARVAALVAAVVGVTAVLGTEPARRVIVTTPQTPVDTSAGPGESDFRQLRMLRRIQLGGQPPPQSGVGEFGAALSQGR